MAKMRRGTGLRWYHGVLAAALLLIALPLGRAMGLSLPGFGEPLPGANLSTFDAGKEEFAAVETVAEGLGPGFNGKSCAECHNNPAVGGDSDRLETRFGRYVGTGQNRKFDPMTERGGSLLQEFAIPHPDTTDPTKSCQESVPTSATVVAKRKTTPLFGLGLVDAVPDVALYAIAALQQRLAPGLAGRVNRVVDAATGAQRAGRFGWKAQQASLFTFGGDAYLNEMGITTPLFPTENAPNGNLDTLRECDTVPDAEDDGEGLDAFFDFMSQLAPPPRGPITPAVQAGESVFAFGCAACHMPTLITGASRNPAFNLVIFHPYSDFLLHDMGSLGDGIEQAGAKGSEIRTAPLWGLRARATFLHDGSVKTIADAILAHEGQGRAAQNYFKQLSSTQRANLLAFLQSL
jgi:CxxC motif-containing protein (DUF1111 family)